MSCTVAILSSPVFSPSRRSLSVKTSSASPESVSVPSSALLTRTAGSPLGLLRAQIHEEVSPLPQSSSEASSAASVLKRRHPAAGGMGGHLYALDFDGVICDSCGESSLSAVKAAKVRWPWVFEQVDAALEEWIVEQMYTLRPVVETGYENLLLVRLLVEIQLPSARQSSVADGLSVQEILENWLKLKPTIMSDWNEDRNSLVDLFGCIRDDWIQNDLSGWIGANRLYPGTADALKFSSSEFYIVTTKQGRFAEALLKELAGIEFPPERIFGLGTGPKAKVLQQLQEMPQHQGLTLHFVEDRLATLKNVMKEPALDRWNLYLVNWGYNTPKEREEARGIPRVQVIDLPDFSKKLK